MTEPQTFRFGQLGLDSLCEQAMSASFAAAQGASAAFAGDRFKGVRDSEAGSAGPAFACPEFAKGRG